MDTPVSTTPAPLVSLTFPAARLHDAEKKVERFARKAAKLELSPPRLEVVRRWSAAAIKATREIDAVRARQAGGLDRGQSVYYFPDAKNVPASLADCEREDIPFVDVAVHGERPIVDGWIFAATIDHADHNLLRKVPGFAGELPKRYRQAAPWCDHCNVHRDRNDSYIVQSAGRPDVFKQVGRSCLQDFLGAKSPEVWLASCRFLRELEDDFTDEYDGDCFGALGAATVDVETFLKYVLVFVRDHGYTSVSKARESYDPRVRATGPEVYGIATTRGPDAVAVRNEYRALFTDAINAKADEVLAWIKSHENADSDYLYNLFAAAGREIVNFKTASLLASAVPVYDRELCAQREQAERTNAHVEHATPGVRMVLTATVSKVVRLPDYGYGSSDLVTLHTADGRALLWKTRDALVIRLLREDEQGAEFVVTDKAGNVTTEGVETTTQDEVEPGETYTLVTGIKELSEYKGIKQTVLTRVKAYGAGVKLPDVAAKTARKHAKHHGLECPAWAVKPPRAKKRRPSK